MAAPANKSRTLAEPPPSRPPPVRVVPDDAAEPPPVAPAPVPPPGPPPEEELAARVLAFEQEDPAGKEEAVGPGWHLFCRRERAATFYRLTGPAGTAEAALFRQHTTSVASDRGHLVRYVAALVFLAGVPEPSPRALAGLLHGAAWWEVDQEQRLAETGVLSLSCDTGTEPNQAEAGRVARCLLQQHELLRAIRAALPRAVAPH